MWRLVWLFVTGGLCVEIQVNNNVVNFVKNDETASAAGNSKQNGISDGIYSYVRTERTENVVTTDYGQVRGYQENGVVQFFDIPYGAIDAERPFQAPSQPERWSGILELVEHRSHCPQINADNLYIGNSTCLTLSIFKPAQNVTLQAGDQTRSSVLFHIHDSSFSTGSGNPLVYRPNNLVSQGVILVLPNYRLGPLGFLCTQNETAPGNAALKDLTLALEWTRNNIAAFGGNASNIVISGSGTGGALVEFLLLSNKSKNYISKAITESGFSLSPWALDRDPLMTARSLLTKLSLDKNSSNALETVDIEILVKAARDIDFKPCIENGSGFLTRTPWDILQDHTLNIPYMMGAANHAGMGKALSLTEETVNQLNNNFSLLLPNDLEFESTEDKVRTGKQIRDKYFGERNITLGDRSQLSLCYTDSEYLHPGIRVARLLVKSGAIIFFYEFSFNNDQIERDIVGAALGDSFNLVFNQSDGNTENINKTRLRDTMTRLWTSFINTGIPTTESVTWINMREVPPDEEEWLSLGAEVYMKRGLHLNRLRFWQDIYDRHFIENNLGSIHKPAIHTLLCLIFWCKFIM